MAEHSASDAFALELAILENSISQLHDPEETIALEPAHLTGMTVENLMTFSLAPRKALQLFAFNYPVNNYYIAVKEGASQSLPALAKTYIAVFRHEDVVWRMELAEHEYQLLNKLFAGMPIGKALDTLQNELALPEDALAPHLSEWFSRWMRNGLLAYNEYRDEPSLRSIA
jgi:hypothetical protein